MTKKYQQVGKTVMDASNKYVDMAAKVDDVITGFVKKPHLPDVSGFKFPRPNFGYFRSEEFLGWAGYMYLEMKKAAREERKKKGEDNE